MESFITPRTVYSERLREDVLTLRKRASFPLRSPTFSPSKTRLFGGTRELLSQPESSILSPHTSASDGSEREPSVCPHSARRSRSSGVKHASAAERKSRFPLRR